jgi:hypothetical protein
MADETPTPEPRTTPPVPPTTDTFNKFPAASPFSFGSTNETGIAVDTYEQHDQVDEFQQKDNIGNIIEVITHNMRSDITCSGEIQSTMAPIVGTVWTPTNLITQQYGPTPPVAAIVLVKGVAYSKGRAKNMSVRITATYYPLVTL